MLKLSLKWTSQEVFPVFCFVMTVAVFTWARITFWKRFRIAIQNVIGIVIWTTCVHMHCKRPSPNTIRICALRVIFCSYCAVRARWLTHVLIAWLQRAFLKCTRHESRSERALHSHVLESGFLGGSRSKTPIFSHFKTHFKSLIWNSFAFTWA